MKKSLKNTLSNLAGYATASVISRFPRLRKSVQDKMTRHTSRKSGVMLYSGIALVVAGAAYYAYKNREAFMAGMSDFLDHYDLKTSPQIT